MEKLKTTLDRGALSQPSIEPSNSRKTLILQRQRILFSAFRADQFSDPDGYLTSLGLVLEQYPDNVITYITDPRTGVQRHLKWPPTIAEITEACDQRVAELERNRRFETWGSRNDSEFPPTQLPPPDVAGRLAQVFVPTDHVRYPALVAWSQTAEIKWWRFGKASDGRDGIWIPWGIWDDRQSMAAPKQEAAE